MDFKPPMKPFFVGYFKPGWLFYLFLGAPPLVPDKKLFRWCSRPRITLRIGATLKGILASYKKS